MLTLFSFKGMGQKMFNFLKRKKTEEVVTHNESNNNPPPSPAEKPETKHGFFKRLKQGLAKTRANLSSGIATILLGKKIIDADLLNQIEMILLTADVGVETTEQLIQVLTEKLKRKELNDPEAVFLALKQAMKDILKPCNLPLTIPDQNKPFVILVVGINGSGKTTTIGKLAHLFKQAQAKVMLAAGDTFRAAAIEQLQVWGERNQVPVIAQQPGADTAAVIYDAMEAATARGVDILIADTAGRLHTQANLMEELKKVKRVVAKIDSESPQEVLIVLDATLGQNALNQVKQFNEAIGVTGIALTKLDGTAKGGIIFTIAQQTKIPIRFIGIGEKNTDLRPFDAEEFVEALFSE